MCQSSDLDRDLFESPAFEECWAHRFYKLCILLSNEANTAKPSYKSPGKAIH
jgi:hypothetical protein